MKYLTTGIIAGLLACSASASSANLRNLQVENCAQYDNQGQCTKCYFRYVVVGGQCVQVSDQCKAWSEANGDCTSCYDGWTLEAGKCVNKGADPKPVDPKPVDPVPVNPPMPEKLTPNCIQYDGKGECTKCEYRAVLINKECKRVSDQCKTWDEGTGKCLSCYEGWNLAAGQCSL